MRMLVVAELPEDHALESGNEAAPTESFTVAVELDTDEPAPVNLDDIVYVLDVERNISVPQVGWALAFAPDLPTQAELAAGTFVDYDAFEHKSDEPGGPGVVIADPVIPCLGPFAAIVPIDTPSDPTRALTWLKAAGFQPITMREFFGLVRPDEPEQIERVMRHPESRHGGSTLR